MGDDEMERAANRALPLPLVVAAARAAQRADDVESARRAGALARVLSDRSVDCIVVCRRRMGWAGSGEESKLRTAELVEMFNSRPVRHARSKCPSGDGRDVVRGGQSDPPRRMDSGGGEWVRTRTWALL